MSKPLIRWTVGSCLQQGLDVLAESIHRTTKTLGIENFDWLICYNALNRENIEFLKTAIGSKPIQLFAQNWIDCPIDDQCQSPRRPDGSMEWNGNRCGGTLWKCCPARMRMESHEIVMDNDIILLQKFPQIDEFLAVNDKVLVLKEPIRFYGRFDKLLPESETYLNSGFMGFPPGYDFGAEIRKNWLNTGSFTNISQADEQGLLMYTLHQMPHITIQPTQMKEVLARDFSSKITGKEEGIHFTQCNRIPNHRSWQQYQKIKSTQVIM